MLDSIHHLEEFEIYINGDLNIAYNVQTSADFSKIKHLESKYQLTQLIKEPTRCTMQTNSILDLILTNSKFISSAGTDDMNISDHQPVWAIRKKHQTKAPRINFECRSFNNFNSMAFSETLHAHDWNNYYNEICVDKLWDEMESVMIEAADLHCPFKKHTQKKVIPKWLSPDIIELIQDRDRLYRLAKQSNQAIDWANARRV